MARNYTSIRLEPGSCYTVEIIHEVLAGYLRSGPIVLEYFVEAFCYFVNSSKDCRYSNDIGIVHTENSFRETRNYELVLSSSSGHICCVASGCKDRNIRCRDISGFG